jgi:hypothetical protein
VAANFGTMTKPFYAGRAASSGIEGMRLAMTGMTAATDTIEHRAGFLAAISPHGKLDLDRSTQRLGQVLRIYYSGLSVKKYPMCYATHGVIDAVINVVHKEKLEPDDIRSVHATCPIEPSFSYADWVRIRLKDGPEFDSGDVRFARENLKLPIRNGELRDKFMDCLRDADFLNAKAIYQQIDSLEGIANVRSLAG